MGQQRHIWRTSLIDAPLERGGEVPIRLVRVQRAVGEGDPDAFPVHETLEDLREPVLFFSGPHTSDLDLAGFPAEGSGTGTPERHHGESRLDAGARHRKDHEEGSNERDHGQHCDSARLSRRKRGPSCDRVTKSADRRPVPATPQCKPTAAAPGTPNRPLLRLGVAEPDGDGIVRECRAARPPYAARGLEELNQVLGLSPLGYIEMSW